MTTSTTTFCSLSHRLASFRAAFCPFALWPALRLAGATAAQRMLCDNGRFPALVSHLSRLGRAVDCRLHPGDVWPLLWACGMCYYILLHPSIRPVSCQPCQPTRGPRPCGPAPVANQPQGVQVREGKAERPPVSPNPSRTTVPTNTCPRISVHGPRMGEPDGPSDAAWLPSLPGDCIRTVEPHGLHLLQEPLTAVLSRSAPPLLAAPSSSPLGPPVPSCLAL